MIDRGPRGRIVMGPWRVEGKERNQRKEGRVDSVRDQRSPQSFFLHYGFKQRLVELFCFLRSGEGTTPSLLCCILIDIWGKRGWEMRQRESLAGEGRPRRIDRVVWCGVWGTRESWYPRIGAPD